MLKIKNKVNVLVFIFMLLLKLASILEYIRIMHIRM